MNDNPDLICLSHLRWDFVLQRPQHLMGRFARNRRVFFFEEPVYEGKIAQLRQKICPETGVYVEKPVLPTGTSSAEGIAIQRRLLNDLIQQNDIASYFIWYYTPMAMQFTGALDPLVTIYDCMDELSAFAGAPESMRVNEAALFRAADLVFTGGASLYESKRKQHPHVHLFPSSVDKDHFARAKSAAHEPEDQKSIPKPRIGYAGVIDERMNLELIRQIAAARPDWQLVLLGPIAKIDPASLPKAPNIHWLGMKAYADLPNYFSGWQIGFLPFAQNEATKFISPTKTPEYLSAGLHVISTPIRDVVSPYGQLGLVSIAADADEFIASADTILNHPKSDSWQKDVADFLGHMSWDLTWNRMEQLIEEVLKSKQEERPEPPILAFQLTSAKKD